MKVMTKGIVMVALLALCAPLTAQEDWSDSGFGDRLHVSLAGFWPELNTSIRVDAKDGTIGTDLDLEDDLDLDKREATPLLKLDWRIKGPHHLQFAWFRLNRSGQKYLEGEVRIEDTVYPVNELLDTSLDSDIWILNYGYDFFHEKERSTFGVMGGFHYIQIDASFRGEGSVKVEESADAKAPLPLIGIFGGYAFTPKWGFYGSGQLFALKFDDYEGQLYNVWLEIYHNPFKNFGWGFGYNWFDFDLDATDTDLTGNLSFTYQGPMVFVKYRLP